MKRWMGIIAIIVLIFTACGDGDDNNDGTSTVNNADFSELYGKWSYTSDSGLTRIYSISKNEIEFYVKYSFANEPDLWYKSKIQTVEEITNNGISSKDEFPKGFQIKSVYTQDGTGGSYSVGTSQTQFYYLNENKDKMYEFWAYTKVE